MSVLDNINPKRRAGMGTIAKTKDRLNLRLQSNAKSIIRRAASFKGESVNKFVLISALDRAEKIIQEHEAMILNRRDSEAFLDALSQPVQFNDELLAVLQEHDQRVVSK